MSIDYHIPLVKQGLQDCAQANAVQILNHYGISKTIDDIKSEVPVYISKSGVPLGSSLGHIATYFITLGFKTTLHTVDIEIFDPSWSGLTSLELIDNLRLRRQHFKSVKYEVEALDVIFDGYIKFLEAGGKIVFPIIDENYLIDLLSLGPIYCSVNYNFLNSTSKYLFEGSVSTHDPVKGSSFAHIVTLAGFHDGQFKVVDPDAEFGGVRLINSSLLVGSIYLAESDYDPLLITLEK